MKKKGAHNGLLPQPIQILNAPANAFTIRFGRYITARDNKWQEQQDSAHSYIIDSLAECPEALTIVEAYRESKAKAAPPQPVSAIELMAALQLRFVGDNQALVEEAQGNYNSFTCPQSCDNVMVKIDKLKLLIQKLTQFGQPPTEESKIEKLKSSVKLKKFEISSVHLSIQPANATFTELCALCKKLRQGYV
jgi:hypothetical protein